MKYIVHRETATETDEHGPFTKEGAVDFVFNKMAGWDSDLFRPVQFEREEIIQALEQGQTIRHLNYLGELDTVFIFRPVQEEDTMTEYNPQLAEALYQDYEFLKSKIEGLQFDLRHFPERERMAPDKEEFGLFWLVDLRAKEYGMERPQNTNVSLLITAREVARETRRRHAKQNVAKIRDDIDRKYN